MAAYAGTTTLVYQTVFGNKRVSLLKVTITNYNATGIPTVKVSAGIKTVDAVYMTVEGGLGNANAPLGGSYDSSADIFYLYKAVNSAVADDTNLSAATIYPYLLVIGT